LKVALAGALLLLVLSACATGEKISRLDAGMSKQQVIDMLGRPDGFQAAGDYEALTYTNRLISGWSWDRADYHVILENNRVIQYGAGTVRQNSPNILVLVH
jgi:hypothetical protein